jgi:excisionase family DNA binding protein
MQDERLFLRPMQAAAMLNVGRSRIYQLMNSGAVPAVRLDRRMWRVPKAAIVRLLEQAMATAPANSTNTAD